MDLDALLSLPNLRNQAGEVAAALGAAAVGDLYRTTLRVQNDLGFGEAVRYLESLPCWRAAVSVLDLGCGPGDLTGQLAARYADKQFVGVDRDAGFIAVAREQSQGLTNCTFAMGDVYEFVGPRADFVIARAVLQHLKEPERFVRRLPELLNPSGVVLFWETTRDNFVVAEPPIPAFDRFYAQVEIEQKRHGGNRDCIAELEAQLGDYPFRLLESASPSFMIAGDAERRLAARYLALAAAAVMKMLPVSLDLTDLFADLVAWYEAPGSQLQLRYRRLLLEHQETPRLARAPGAASTERPCNR